MPKRFYVDTLPSKAAPVIRHVRDRKTGAVLASFAPDDLEGAFALRNRLNEAPNYTPPGEDADADADDAAPRFYVDSHGPKGARTGYDVCDRDAGEIVLSFAGDKRAEAFALRNALRAAEASGGQ